MHTEFEPLSTHSSTGVLSCCRERPLCHSLFRGQHPGGGVGLSHCTWLMQGPCLLEAVVKETLCLEASTDPLPKLGLGPLSACLTGGVVGVWKPCKPTAVARYRDERSWPWKVQRQSFPLRQPPPLFFHLLSLPVNLSLSFTPFSPFLLHASPLCHHLLNQSLLIPILCCCLCLALCRSVPG